MFRKYFAGVVAAAIGLGLFGLGLSAAPAHAQTLNDDPTGAGKMFCSGAPSFIAQGEAQPSPISDLSKAFNDDVYTPACVTGKPPSGGGSGANPLSALCPVAVQILQPMNDQGGSAIAQPLASALGCTLNGPTTTTTAPSSTTTSSTTATTVAAAGGGGSVLGATTSNRSPELPRTGVPEMLAGLGFGLTSLGMFARRFRT